MTRPAWIDRMSRTPIWRRTTEPGALVAGDGARILGAKIAVATGCIW